MTIELDAPAGAVRMVDRSRWFGLAVLAVGQLIVALDLMVMLIALPTIGHALKMSPDASQWVITAYSLTYGALLLLGGRIIDYGGRKRAFVIGGTRDDPWSQSSTIRGCWSEAELSGEVSPG